MLRLIKSETLSNIVMHVYNQSQHSGCENRMISLRPAKLHSMFKVSYILKLRLKKKKVQHCFMQTELSLFLLNIRLKSTCLFSLQKAKIGEFCCILNYHFYLLRKKFLRICQLKRVPRQRTCKTVRILASHFKDSSYWHSHARFSLSATRERRKGEAKCWPPTQYSNYTMTYNRSRQSISNEPCLMRTVLCCMLRALQAGWETW